MKSPRAFSKAHYTYTSYSNETPSIFHYIFIFLNPPKQAWIMIETRLHSIYIMYTCISHYFMFVVVVVEFLITQF